MRCTKCEFENPAGMKFCGQCTAPLALTCPKCEFDNPPGFKFCGQCTAPLQRDAATARPKSTCEKPVAAAHVAAEQTDESGLDGERKTVTALFADIKGSTELEQDLDPEEARAIVDPALKLMIDAVRRYDGYIVQSTGDGIFALFGAPVAHEDHPQRALHAALRMQEELKGYSMRLREAGNLPIEARVGVNTGEVVVRSIATGGGHTEYTPIGHTTNLASRMQALAPTGSIAISEQTRKLVEGYFALKPMGPTKIKGISEPVNVYEVTGLGPIRTRLQRAAGRGYTKFVGREREMEVLKLAAEQAKAGHGQIVAAIADAGVGKSRLVFEFKATSQSGWLVLEAFSVSHGKATAYLPLIELLHDYFGIEPDDGPRRRREKVAGKVTMLDRSSEEDTLPYLFALLGIVEGADPFAQMDAQVRRRRTQDTVKRILLRESLKQPLMVIFEDLHWIDEETQAFLNLLAEGIANAPALLLVNYRPEYTHPWGSKTYYTQLRLDPLGKDSASEMLSALVGDAPELVPLKRLILERTHGTPLFMEELVRALFDEGVLVRNGSVKVTKSVSQIKIPPTVQGILASRIDSLPPDEKDLLQTLAVIGTKFPLSLVRKVVQLSPDQLDSRLSGLQMGEFIYEQPASNDIEYSFKHALTHDVAYNSLLTERRRLLHERTAQAIEALYHEGLEDYYADLAHHYGSSNNAAKAAEYLRLVGEQAVDRGAYEQAAANVQPALRLIERLPDGVDRLQAELGVRLMEGRIVSVLHGMASTERLNTFQRVCELSEELGDDSSLIRGLFNIGFAYANRGEAVRAQEAADRCLGLAEQNQNREMLPRVHVLLARCAYAAGDWIQAASLLSEPMERFRSAYPGIAAGFIPINLWSFVPALYAFVQLAFGRPNEALKLSDESLRRARQLKHPYTLAWALAFAAILHSQRREPEAVRSLAEAAIALAEEHGLPERVAEGRLFRGWAMAELGQTEQALADLEAATAASTSISFLRIEIVLGIYVRVGRTDKALVLLEENLARLERSGAHLHESQLYQLKAEAILMRDSSATAAAEECLRKSIEIARGQSAKWWELRATTNLARLLAKQGKRPEARAMLAEIYNWFTEGFETADLKDAKALLVELSG